MNQISWSLVENYDMNMCMSNRLHIYTHVTFRLDRDYGECQFIKRKNLYLMYHLKVGPPHCLSKHLVINRPYRSFKGKPNSSFLTCIHTVCTVTSMSLTSTNSSMLEENYSDTKLFTTEIIDCIELQSQRDVVLFCFWFGLHKKSAIIILLRVMGKYVFLI